MSAQALIEQIVQLSKEAQNKIASVQSEADLAEFAQSYAGKKSMLTQVMKQLGALTPDERSLVGKSANEYKEALQHLLTAKESELLKNKFALLKETEFIDLSINPPYYAELTTGFSESGHIHPISATQKKLEDIFTSMGFTIVDGPQIENDYHNFGALNFSDDHPARDMQDTFYTESGHLLRTHTSTIQVRALSQMKPPLRIIAPGRVFRYEEIDASHEHTFYQMEGMVVDRRVSVGNLLHLMQTLLAEVFESEVDVRLRPGYFPFVEPGFELDMKCLVCAGSGCSVCKHSGWVEVLPCGLVHPNVLKSAGLDPNEWQGAAFGLGLNRLVMMQYGIEDIRHFMSGKMSFLRQFSN